LKLDSESDSENGDIIDTEGEEVKEIDLQSTDGETTAASAIITTVFKG